MHILKLASISEVVTWCGDRGGKGGSRKWSFGGITDIGVRAESPKLGHQRRTFFLSIAALVTDLKGP